MFPITGRKPAVQGLSVHEEQKQLSFFQENTPLEDIQPRHTTLTRWLEYNNDCAQKCALPVEHPDHMPANHLKSSLEVKYADMLSKFVWEKNVWKPRKATPTSATTSIGRMYLLPPSIGEAYYLRCILTVAIGREATSWKALRCFDNVEYPTYKAAADARGLLMSDEIWFESMAEADTYLLSKPLRIYFCNLLVNGEVADPFSLYESFKMSMYHDFQQYIAEDKVRKCTTLDINNKYQSTIE